MFFYFMLILSLDAEGESRRLVGVALEVAVIFLRFKGFENGAASCCAFNGGRKSIDMIALIFMDLFYESHWLCEHFASQIRV